MSRRFHLQRDIDETGVSGTGHVAEGVLFANGEVAMTWLGDLTSVVVYRDIGLVERIHGHNGKTKLTWDDPEELRN